MRKLLAVALLILPALSSARDIPAADSACDQSAEPARWSAAGTPDKGLQPPLISAHRGGVTLAPENTMAAYEIAFAYGMDLVEVDVRETLDGRFFSMHDSDADRTTDGSGAVDFMLASQITQLNAADFEPWKGGDFDPAPVPFLEDILALAERTGKGIEFDIKSVRNYPLFLLLVAQYPGVYERSFFNASGLAGQALQTVQPRVRLIYNLAGGETPETLFDETMRSSIFGSRLDKFSAEQIAAIHDGCGYVLPHTYDEGHELEGAQFLAGRALGIDGAQSDQPDVIRGLLDDPVPTRLEIAADAPDRVCLVNADNGLGLPYKTLELQGSDGKALDPVQTRKAGCARLPAAATALSVRFSGDATAQSALLGSAGKSSAIARFGGALGPALLLPLLLLAALTGCSRIPGSIALPKDAATGSERLEPVIRCAPENASLAAGKAASELAACSSAPLPEQHS